MAFEVRQREQQAASCKLQAAKRPSISVPAPEHGRNPPRADTGPHDARSALAAPSRGCRSRRYVSRRHARLAAERTAHYYVGDGATRRWGGIVTFRNWQPKGAALAL